MQFQNFRGSDVTEALSQVRHVLGPDAVIRATRRVKGGSPLDRGYVEIEAAAGEPVARPAAVEPTERVRRATFAEVPSRRATRGAQSAVAPPAPAPVRAPAGGKAASTASTDVNRKLAELRAAVEALQAACTPRARSLGYLHAAGVEGTLANELAHGAPRSAKAAQGSGTWLRKNIAQRLRVTSSLIERPGPQLIAAVGPTGAGKTTTLAKLAARARLDLGRSVGVISLDTFRVGAVEQWQRYARLIGMPFFAARDADDFARALASMDTDILLVDTEGQVAGDGAPLQRLAASLEHAPGWDKNVMLVVPAWLRGADVDRLVRSYPDPRPTAVVATKLDEATRIGGVLHACLPASTPLAYVCDGPRVPEDISTPDVETVAARIFPRELLS